MKAGGNRADGSRSLMTINPERVGVEAGFKVGAQSELSGCLDLTRVHEKNRLCGANAQKYKKPIELINICVAGGAF